MSDSTLSYALTRLGTIQEETDGVDFLISYKNNEWKITLIGSPGHLFKNSSLKVVLGTTIDFILLKREKVILKPYKFS